MSARIATTDWCPARLTPHPPDVPRDRQLRAVLVGDELIVMWLERVGLCKIRLPAAGYRARQAGCRCTAHPRLTGEPA